MQYQDFIDKLESIFLGQHNNIIPEEKYFRKLLYQLELHSSEQPTATLILEIFENSLHSEAVEFEDEWNKLSEPELFHEQDEASIEEELELAKNTIKFMIADLRRLGDKVLKDPHRGLGITSPKGASWYNFDICSIVYGYSGFCFDALETSGSVEEPDEIQSYSWNDISDILLIGKGYE